MTTCNEHQKDDSVAFFGTTVHSTEDDKMVICPNAIIGVKNGKIIFHQKGATVQDANELCEKAGIADLRVLVRGQFLMPGLIDTHIHAPQYVIVGTGYSLQLMDWLSTYTFPNEAKFSDLSFAENCYRKVVRRTLLNGTTTACYYATIHTDASLLLAQIMNEFGQRGYVGKVCMDRNSPDYYVETTEESLKETRRFVLAMQAKFSKESLITPCITPRFAISCSNDLMKGLASIAKEFQLPIQTHMSENLSEIDFVKDDHGVDEYVHVYENAGLLTDKTILAHCVHSTNKELSILKQYNCGISHCPNSNTSIRSGTMSTRLVQENGVKLGLGTDVSGGYSPSIKDSMRSAINVSKILSCVFNKELPDYKAINHDDAFYLATLGGANVLGLQDKVGNLDVGKEFDALVVDANTLGSPFDIFPSDTIDDIIQKFIFLGDDRSLKSIFVKGREITIS